jgi:alpha-1,2-mannosyltransferase
VCLAGVGGAVAVAASRRPSGSRKRMGLRVATAGAAMLACFAVLPLPAGADPTFKAYTLADAGNPRYFFFCRSKAICAELPAGAAVHFGTARERTKVRVNGVVDDSVARLEYQSAPGGAPRAIPLVEIHPGLRAFSFRSANMTSGRLAAYGADGSLLATFIDELP